MNTCEGRRRPISSAGSVWTSVLAIGCVLVVLIAMLLPRQSKHSGSEQRDAVLWSAASAPMRSAGQSSRLRATLSEMPGPTAQEIVAGKIIQFAHKRRETVQAMAQHFKVDVPEE